MRHFVSIPILDYSGPAWCGGSPVEQGYEVLELPHLGRINAKNNEYYIYTSDKEFKAVEADSVASAILASQIQAPFKIVHAHCRLADVFHNKQLEFKELDSHYMAKQGFVGKNPGANVAPEVIQPQTIQPENTQPTDNQS